MLKVIKDAPSIKGHKMVEVLCSFCGESSVKRLTSLKTIKSCGCRSYEHDRYLGKEYINKSGNIAVVKRVLSGGVREVYFVGYEEFDNCFFKQKHLEKGNFKNPWEVVHFGVGYAGSQFVGKFPHKTKIRDIWVNMLSRCYNTECKEYSWYGGRGVYVQEDWYNFYNFYNWYYSKMKDSEIIFHLDKDLLSKGEKCYSEDTCCLLPREINTSLTGELNPTGDGKYRVRVTDKNGKRVSYGFLDREEALMVYADKKTQRITALAEKYKDVLEEHVYQKLLVLEWWSEKQAEKSV